MENKQNYLNIIQSFGKIGAKNVSTDNESE